MSSHDATSATPKGPSPISRVLTPIRGQLIVAAGLAAVGLVLGLAAVLAASIFHFGTYTIAEAKAHMAAAGIAMRLD